MTSSVESWSMEGMVMKPGEVICCMFLLAILEVDHAQNLTKCKRWLCVLIQAATRITAVT